MPKQAIQEALQAVEISDLGSDLVTSKKLKSLELVEGKAKISIDLGYPSDSTLKDIESRLKAALSDVSGVDEVEINLACDIKPHRVHTGVDAVANIKNIIAVASGKGGVGKSTTSVNLALALQAEGARVGLLDADIYGPSQPIMLGTSTARPESTDKNSIEPVMAHGLQTMSMGYLLEQSETPVVWRGPMATGALMQLFNDTRWDNLDYLIVDLPPGTGDIQLTMAQKMPISGAVIVTTPQDVALLDAKKAYKMFEKVKIPVLGIIENMSTHICSSCGHEEAIFGFGGGSEMAAAFDIPLLGKIPLSANIRIETDAGRPTVASGKDAEVAARYAEAARKLSAALSLTTRDFRTKFSDIVIQTSKG